MELTIRWQSDTEL